MIVASKMIAALLAVLAVLAAAPVLAAACPSSAAQSATGTSTFAADISCNTPGARVAQMPPKESIHLGGGTGPAAATLFCGASNMTFSLEFCELEHVSFKLATTISQISPTTSSADCLIDSAVIPDNTNPTCTEPLPPGSPSSKNCHASTATSIAQLASKYWLPPQSPVCSLFSSGEHDLAEPPPPNMNSMLPTAQLIARSIQRLSQELQW